MRLVLCSPGQSEPAGTRTQGNDTNTHILADVIFPDGMNVNHRLVKDGVCWWHRKYAPGDMAVEGLEGKHERPRNACE
jgi:endonuclease YncB( thermonuclease family)